MDYTYTVMTMTMTMKTIYLTINQEIAKYSSKFLLLYVINWSGDYY